MKMFYLDTSSSFLYTAIFEDNDIIDQIQERLDKNLSSLSLTHINGMFEKNNLSFSDIDKVIVVNGPGSFTGIRIGLTIAKTLAWSRKIPIITVSSLEAMALSYEGNKKYIVPAIDARRNYVFAGIYDNETNNYILKEQYINVNTLEVAMDSFSNDILYITNDSISTNYDHIEYVPNISKIVKTVESREGTNPHAVDANYLKKTEAEENHDC